MTPRSTSIRDHLRTQQPTRGGATSNVYAGATANGHADRKMISYRYFGEDRMACLKAVGLEG